MFISRLNFRKGVNADIGEQKRKKKSKREERKKKKERKRKKDRNTEKKKKNKHLQSSMIYYLTEFEVDTTSVASS